MSSDTRGQFSGAENAAKVAQLISDAEGWRPTTGDEVRGTVVAVKSAKRDESMSQGRNPLYPIVFVLNSDEKVVAVHCFQTVLENEIRSARPLPGETIFIKCLGPSSKTPPKGMSAPILYSVYVDREGSNTDPWEHM